MSLPDEYDTWRCDDCINECKAEWQCCDCCDDKDGFPDPDCDSCSGAGGGHVCIHEL